jgi:biotin carboxylase
MIVVLSLYRPRLEDFLAARGTKILALIPDSMRLAREATNPEYPIRTIDQWDNYNELARLAGEFESLGVTAVTTIDEPCIRAAAFLRDLLGLPGQDHEGAVACTDKSVMKRRLAAEGIPVAEHRIVHSVAQIRDFLDEIGGDIVVKPRCGFGTINTHRVSHDNFDELAAAGAFAPPRDLPEYFRSTTMTSDLGRVSYMVERYVDVVAEYHCELMLHEGSEVHCLAGRYTNPILSDHAVGSVWLDHQSPEAIKVRKLTRAAASALGMTHGFGHCEVFRDRSGRWLVGEFASRPGGLMIPRSLQLSYGIDNLALMADQLAGRRPSTEPGNHARGTIAWLAVPVESGMITNMPDEGQLLSLPGVIEAEIAMRPGDSSKGLASSMYHAAYVFCIGDNPQEAEEFAKYAQRACRIAVDPAA